MFNIELQARVSIFHSIAFQNSSTIFHSKFTTNIYGFGHDAFSVKIKKGNYLRSTLMSSFYSTFIVLNNFIARYGIF